MVTVYCYLSRKAGIACLVTILSVFFCCNLASAQTCTGTPGEPIINITFGQGAGYGPKLAAGTTTFNYQSAGCPNDNEYVITDQSSTCNTGIWHTVTQDHTGDANGRFMLVNASSTPDDFYVQQVDGLCSGTTYQFSAYIMNMITAVGGDPDVTFSVEKTDGTPIKTFNTGSVPKTADANWQFYHYEFDLPDGVSSVILRLRNNALLGLGNDLALDDIVFRPIGPPVSINIQGKTATTNPVPVCSNDMPVILESQVGACYPNTSYIWQVNKNNTGWVSAGPSNTPTYTLSSSFSATYQYRLIAADDGNFLSPNCRVISNVITINVTQSTNLSFQIYLITIHVCESQPVTFTADKHNLPGFYNWLVNGNTVATTTEPEFTTTTLKDGQAVRCIFTTEVPIQCAPPGDSNTFKMEVSGTYPSVDINPSKTEICKGEKVSFNATPADGTKFRYQWLVNNSTVGTNSPEFETSDLKDGDVVDCQITNVTGCIAPALSNKSITMSVSGALTSLSISSTSGSVCMGQSATFTATPATAVSYQWFINGNLVLGESSYTFAPANLQDGDIIDCRAIGTPGCSTPVAADKTITMHVIKPVTMVNITPSATAICKGSAVTFTATADQTEGVTYQWLVNGQPVTSDGNKLIKTDLNNNDAISCTAVSAANCFTPVPATPIIIPVENLPQITLPQTYYEIYQGESVTLANTATGNGLTYKWSPATGLDKTDIATPVAHPAQTTQYTLLVTSPTGCTTTSGAITVKVRVKDIIVPNTFTPNNDGINDKWEIPGLADDPTAEVKVLNRYGSLVYYSHSYQSAWDGKFKGTTLPSGVYYYVIRTQTRKLSGSVTIIR